MIRDRYQIYELLGHRVRAIVPPRFGGGEVKGVVDSVYRDVISKTIALVVGDDKFVFREPSEVLREGQEIAFVYREFPDTDPQPIDGIIAETEPPVVAVVSFEVEGLE